MSLKAEDLHRDPRIAQAKLLLLETIRDHTEKLTAIAPAKQGHAISYQQWIQAFSLFRGTKLFYPYLGSGFGHGSLVELADGSVKYDMITGIGVHFFGHNFPDLIASSFDAACQSTIMQGNLQQNKGSLELLEGLIELSGLPHCFLTTSGVMANENALKIALQKNTPANRILAFEHCFAGRTLTFSQITDKPSFREGLPTQLAVDYIPFFDYRRPEESIEKAIAELKKHIERYPNAHAAMIFELIQGEAGVNVGTRLFFESLMKICKQHRIAVFVDEVQTFGRTNRLFAFQHFALEEYVDVVTIGKLAQLGATFFTDEYCPKPGLLSQTYTSSTASLLGCKAILNALINGKLYGAQGRIEQIHRRFTRLFHSIETEYPALVNGPYGIGAMIAFTPFDGSIEKTTKFVHALFEAGVIGLTAGTEPCRVRFLVPAGCITDEDIDTVMKIVQHTLKNVSH